MCHACRCRGSSTQLGVVFFFLTFRRPRTSPLFPYTTLSRSTQTRLPDAQGYLLKVHPPLEDFPAGDRKSTRLNSSHVRISYAVFCLKKKMTTRSCAPPPRVRCPSCSCVRRCRWCIVACASSS